MLGYKIKHLVVLILFAIAFEGNAQRRIVYNEPAKTADSLKIHEGIISTKQQKILYKRDGRKVATIKLSEPVMVAMADREEEWGYFQFPVLAKANDGTLIVDWQMKADSHTTYGVGTARKHVPMISSDKGKKWKPLDRSINVVTDSYKEELKNGNVLQVYTPKAEDLSKYGKNLKAIAKSGNQTFYKLDELPDELQGVYLKVWNPDLRVNKIIHAKLSDSRALRNAIDGQMPVVWWGNIKDLNDGALIAGTYPSYHLGSDGKVMPYGVSFYRSNDNGLSWEVIGDIPYQPDFKRDPIAPYKVDGAFGEPAFDILQDSTFICVMRTGGASPMYKSFSKDKGMTWTKPEPFTPNGVKPMLLSLKNGVLVLASGRPGVQIRFSLDGSGKTWTDPIEMMPFMEGGKYDLYASCGYTSLLEADNNSFYIVYSDFKTKDKDGKNRKAIMFRKITVKRAK